MNLQWEGETLVTYGDIGRAVVKIAKAGDAEKANRFMEAYADVIADRASGDAMQIAHNNIGYLSGYYDRELMTQILTVFGVTHPVFGGAEQAATLNNAQAWAKGLAAADKMTEGS